MSQSNNSNSLYDYIETNKYVTYLVGAGQLVFLLICFFVLNQSMFTQDTWSYFELSKTIFSEKFYFANTIRSYLYFPQSASFPFGYPLFLALVNSCLGDNPANSVVLNIICAVISFLLIARLSSLLCFTNICTAALSSSLLMFPGYIDEVLAGRSLPLSIAFVLLGLTVGLKYPATVGTLLAGFFFGLSVLVRFDFITHAFATLFLFWYLKKAPIRTIFILTSGFFCGVLPWVVYSYLYFHKFWISDNSWVALAAHNAFVLDFPAKATSSIFSNPYDWLRKFGWNTIRLVYHFLKALVLNPLLLVMLLYSFSIRNKLFTKYSNYLFIILITLSLTLVPYAMTGYFNARYFTYVLFGLTVLLMCLLYKEEKVQILNSVIVAVAVVSIIIGVGSVLNSKSKKVNADETTQLQAIHEIYGCQKKYSNFTFVFSDDVISFKYGALTQNKTVIIPSNFSTMSGQQKEEYLSFIGPHIYVGNLLEFRCPVDVEDFAKLQL